MGWCGLDSFRKGVARELSFDWLGPELMLINKLVYVKTAILLKYIQTSMAIGSSFMFWRKKYRTVTLIKEKKGKRQDEGR